MIKVFHSVLHFAFIEPEIIAELEVNLEAIVINLNTSVSSRGRTFDIDLPYISMKYGPFRLVYEIHEVSMYRICLCILTVIFTLLWSSTAVQLLT